MAPVLTPRPCCSPVITGPLAFSAYAAVQIQALSEPFGDSALQKCWGSGVPMAQETTRISLLQNCLFRQGQEQRRLCESSFLGNIDLTLCATHERGDRFLEPEAQLYSGAWNFLHKAPDSCLVLLLYVP